MDLLPCRGNLAYPGAAGEAVMAAVMQYLVASAKAGDAPSGDGADARPTARAPLVLDPFCGHGTVLALANAYGLDAFGIDINPNRCEGAVTRQPKPEDDSLSAFGRSVSGPLSYWSPLSAKAMRKASDKRRGGAALSS